MKTADQLKDILHDLYRGDINKYQAYDLITTLYASQQPQTAVMPSDEIVPVVILPETRIYLVSENKEK